jgi:amino-acid N-acetyltransferase
LQAGLLSVASNNSPLSPQQAFVRWFRDSSPFIHAYRNKTFVIFFEGEAVLDADFDHHIHDFALLSSLGVRLVLVHGIRRYINQRLAILKHPAHFHNRRRITDDVALRCAKEAAGLVRVEIEALLSIGLINSPMAGYELKVASGNFITAQPIGVVDGIDYGHTGEVRSIDSTAIQHKLDQSNIVLISSIGYSSSGEVFNLSAKKLATEVAISLKAEKLILMTEQSCCHPENGQEIRQMAAGDADDFLQKYPTISELVYLPMQAAIQACRRGVKRVHLIDRSKNGALLLELFTQNGAGLLISSALSNPEN